MIRAECCVHPPLDSMDNIQLTSVREQRTMRMTEVEFAQLDILLRTSEL